MIVQQPTMTFWELDYPLVFRWHPKWHRQETFANRRGYPRIRMETIRGSFGDLVLLIPNT